MEKRFYKSRTDKKLAGVCAGVAEYFEVDPTLVRLLWVVFTFAGGAGVIAYIIAAIVMPEAPGTTSNRSANQAAYKAEPVEGEVVEDMGEGPVGTEDFQAMEKEVHFAGEKKEDKNSMVLGAALILIGLMFFSRNFFKWFWIDFSYLWPILLILLGVFLVVNKRK